MTLERRLGRRGHDAPSRTIRRVDDAVAFASYLVRASCDAAGAVTGTVIRVRSGDRVRFQGIECAVRALAALLAADMRVSGGTDNPSPDAVIRGKQPTDPQPSEGDQRHEHN